jgi:hypothetical protein
MGKFNFVELHSVKFPYIILYFASYCYASNK